MSRGSTKRAGRSRKRLSGEAWEPSQLTPRRQDAKGWSISGFLSAFAPWREPLPPPWAPCETSGGLSRCLAPNGKSDDFRYAGCGALAPSTARARRPGTGRPTILRNLRMDCAPGPAQTGSVTTSTPETTGSLPPPTAEATAPTQRRPTLRDYFPAFDRGAGWR